MVAPNRRLRLPYNSAMRPSFLALPLLACAALSAGCVTRTISITSEPTGARVFLNDREVGRTPLTTGFTFYGVYDVRLEQDGCIPLWTKATASEPWWEYPGVDLLAELTGPKRVDIPWHFKLEPQPPVAAPGSATDLARQQALTVRAKQMQEINRQSVDAVDAMQRAAAEHSAASTPSKP